MTTFPRKAFTICITIDGRKVSKLIHNKISYLSSKQTHSPIVICLLATTLLYQSSASFLQSSASKSTYTNFVHNNLFKVTKWYWSNIKHKSFNVAKNFKDFFWMKRTKIIRSYGNSRLCKLASTLQNRNWRRMYWGSRVKNWTFWRILWDRCLSVILSTVFVLCKIL